jgi:hypothetical protein
VDRKSEAVNLVNFVHLKWNKNEGIGAGLISGESSERPGNQ